MTIDVTIASTAKVFNAYGQRITGSQALDPAFAHSLIMAGLATANTPGQHPPPVNSMFNASDAIITVNSDQTLSSGYIGTTIVCAVAVNLTFPENLPPGFAVLIMPPPSGNVTITPGGNTKLNGASTALTRSLASNANGFLVAEMSNLPNQYTVNGS